MATSGNDGDEYQITNINVTPLVDIMLVLLIIFLVTATYIVKEAVHVELPKASAAGETTPHTLQVLITKEGRTFLDGRETSDAGLLAKVRALPDRKDDVQALVSADRDAHHGAVIHVLDLLRGEGISKFSIQVRHDGAP